MSKSKMGLSSKDDAIICYLKENNVNFRPIISDCLIPIQELFYYFVISGMSPGEYDNLDSLEKKLPQIGLEITNKSEEKSISQIKRTIRSSKEFTGSFLSYDSPAGSSKWAYIKWEDENFILKFAPEDCPKTIESTSLKKSYCKGFFQIRPKKGCERICVNIYTDYSKELISLSPFYFFESDLYHFSDLLYRMQNFILTYWISRSRMKELFSNDIDLPIMNYTLRKAQKYYAISTHLKNTDYLQRICFTILQDMNKNDIALLKSLNQKTEEKGHGRNDQWSFKG